jgi:hypothetical protein
MESPCLFPWLSYLIILVNRTKLSVLLISNLLDIRQHFIAGELSDNKVLQARQMSMPRAGFKLAILVFEQSKSVQVETIQSLRLT